MQRLEVSANACSVITSLKGLYCFLFLSPIRGTPCTVTPKCLSPGIICPENLPPLWTASPISQYSQYESHPLAAIPDANTVSEEPVSFS